MRPAGGSWRAPQPWHQSSRSSKERRECGDQQRCVDAEADQALFGSYGYRLGVGDGYGCSMVGAVVAVGGSEGAGAVALQGPVAEQVRAAADEVGATAGVAIHL